MKDISLSSVNLFEKKLNPLVSMMMPVFNGENFIRLSIESLLNQDYENFELIILDNQSTDKTRSICEEYVNKDSRVHYICDESQCISHEGANRLIHFAKGEYCMIACDDDLYSPNYVSKLIKQLEENKNVGMVFSRMELVDVHGNILNTNYDKIWFNSGNSRIKNFIYFLFLRACVPMVFGIFRTRLYKQALPFQVFDKTLYDADNKFMLEFLANNKVHCIDNILFYYRSKNRNLEKEGSTDKKSRTPSPKNMFGRYIYLAVHQINFTFEIFKIIFKSEFNIFIKGILIIITTFSFLYYLLDLIPVFHKLIYVSRSKLLNFLSNVKTNR